MYYIQKSEIKELLLPINIREISKEFVLMLTYKAIMTILATDETQSRSGIIKNNT